MARRRNFVRGAAAIGRKRETIWIEQAHIVDTVAGSSAVLVSLLTTEELAFRPFTILRTRGLFHISSDQTVATERYICSMGLAVVSEQAAAIGISAIPTPETDMSSDLWFVYESLTSEFIFKSGVGVEGTNGILKHWDSKGMRKVEDGEQVVVVLEAPGTSFGVNVVTQFRMLIRRN